MSISLIKVLSCAIFIAKKYNNKILTILLKDHAKDKLSKEHYIFVLLLVACYEKDNIFADWDIYKILDAYIYIHGNKLCKHLLYI